ncbi:glycerol kinase GlpK [Microseira wollei]|uniref:Glycerol kinase n=1 Tax=Microseira wollei NIES-4236 TaxID=2530354 RepID=A0AAV3XDK4_9CYAN|nr:glycerol kinase GlpK [Microseira wollei]GET40323.1 glycerol kinase [Microseira wollei NIES-4236]
MTKYIAAIDSGTTSTRFIIFEKAGKIVTFAQKEHEQIYPNPGWVEHSPTEIWERTQTVIDEALDRGNIAPQEITAIGITNQRETIVVWNRHTGKPYYNAIVWQDTRTDNICNELAQNGGIDRFRAQVGLPLATYFSGPKIKWMLDNITGLRAAALSGDAIFGNIDTFLIWHLSGGTQGGLHITDVTNASRTMLMNLATLEWDKEILEILDIPQQMLPEIRPSSQVYGHVVGRLAGVPIAADLGDQQAALVGQTCFAPGEAKNTYGTGCFMLLNTGNEQIASARGLLTTVAYKMGDEPAVYALEGSVAIAGALVQWLRDNLGMISTSAEVEALANLVEDNGGVYFVPAFSGLFAPYWRADARGAIVGLTRYVQKGHIARAVLEATAWQTREILDAMEQDSGVKLTALKVDGGMVGNETLMQFQSDVLGVPVIRPLVAETTALGAAYAAGLATGFWSSINELQNNWGVDKVWEPNMMVDVREAKYAQWKKAVTKTFDWV